MAQTVKLNKWEQEVLEARLNYLNKKLVMNGFRTLKSESEIVHKIIEMTINKIVSCLLALINDERVIR